LRQAIDRIFQAKTKRTAQRRYDKVMDTQDDFISADPLASAIFDGLHRHWPQLVDAIESQQIPLTNNTTELVIRRFEQHYQNFCGFNSASSAQTYLAVFEWTYRLTPFSADAQPRIRGKCPLEVAGYDVSTLPLTKILRGHLLGWSPLALAQLVPNA